MPYAPLDNEMTIVSVTLFRSKGEPSAVGATREEGSHRAQHDETEATTEGRQNLLPCVLEGTFEDEADMRRLREAIERYSGDHDKVEESFNF